MKDIANERTQIMRSSLFLTFGPRWRAMDSARALWPFLALAKAAKLAPPRRLPVAPRMMMLPLPLSTMSGITCLQHDMQP